MKNPTLKEFLDGAPIQYPAAKGRRPCEASLVDETTVSVADPKGNVTFATIEPDRAAALYHNLTRMKPC